MTLKWIVAQYLVQQGLYELLSVQVDGAISLDNIGPLYDAGATEFVIVSSIFKAKTAIAEAIALLKQQVYHSSGAFKHGNPQ